MRVGFAAAASWAGVRVTSLPATAEKVDAAVKAKRAQEARRISDGASATA